MRIIKYTLLLFVFFSILAGLTQIISLGGYSPILFLLSGFITGALTSGLYLYWVGRDDGFQAARSIFEK